VLIVAPFHRGRAHGGSLRATAMAERLEDRGARVDWVTVPAKRGTAAQKAAALLAGRPGVVRAHNGRRATLDGAWDAAIAAHSYMAPHLDGLPAGVRRLVDFHNLEWRVLEALGRGAGGARGAYLRAQARLMRRFERGVAGSAAVAAFASAEERTWATRRAGAAGAVVVPNVLPVAAEREALATAALRGAASARGARLVYVGTLTFPPNVQALLGFLERCWPAVRAAAVDAELLVAGACAPGVAAAVDRHRGVRALGFVEDLPALLGGAAAAVLPFDGQGGSSLRCLHYGLARVPVVAAPAAARGLRFSPGLIARDAREWAGAVRDCLEGADRVRSALDEAEAGARAIQDDEAPWDELWSLLAGTRSAVTT
jgi:glycosyltransferase involved in cell wall biosynthesis